MIIMSASESKLKFGEMIDKAIKEPVQINKYNRPYVVVMSKEYYDYLLDAEFIKKSQEHLWNNNLKDNHRRKI